MTHHKISAFMKSTINGMVETNKNPISRHDSQGVVYSAPSTDSAVKICLQKKRSFYKLKKTIDVILRTATQTSALAR